MSHPSVLSIVRRFALLLALLPALALARATDADFVPVAGTDYVVIEGGTPYRPLAGKVEVAEVFAYWCVHCAQFQPALAQWKRKLPAHVRFTPVPAVFNRNDAFARAFFAVESTRTLARVHQPLFDALHVRQALSRHATVDEVAGYLGGLGLDAARLRAAMLAGGVDRQLQQARDFAIRSGVEGTPTLIVNGKYRVQGTSQAHNLRIADALVAMERRSTP